MNKSRLTALVGLAILFTLLNAVKPLHIDDTAYYFYASQIAEHPFDPYGFDIHWYDFPLPARDVLAPPVLLYWWAAGLKLFGDQPLLWKAWLFPFSLLLVFALHSLLRRFTPGREIPLLCMAVFSPTVLPSFNLMLDVPTLALALAALALFIRSVERDSVGTAILAGLVAGVATETKYTGLLAPCVLLLFAGVHRRWRWGLLAAAVAAVVFLSVEGLIAVAYGESHFLHHWRANAGSVRRPLHLGWPLIGILGGTASAVGLLALAALGASRRVVLGLAAAFGLGLLFLAVVPEASSVLWREGGSGKSLLTLNQLVVGPAGLIVCGALAAAAWRLGREGSAINRFLVLWLLLELAGYFILTPFAAARRVLGLAVVGTLLAGRLATLTGRRALGDVAVVGVLLGLGFYAVDFRDAATEQAAVEGAADWVRERDGGRIWFVGHWGFQFYGQRAGLVPLLPTDERPQPGEWVISPDSRVTQQPWYAGRGRAEVVTTLDWHDGLGLRTVPCYYGGNTPLEHHEGPRVRVTIYRVSDGGIRKPEEMAAAAGLFGSKFHDH